MKVLVIGREGQVARSLDDCAAAHPDITLIHLARPDVDLAIPGQASAAIMALSPDIVINAAAYTDVDCAEDEPDLALRINAEAAGEVAAAAAALHVPIVHFSTDYVFDGCAGTPIDEQQPTAPLGVYGRSKLAGEELVRAANPDHAILRTAWVISPYSRNFARTMLRAAGERETLRVVADQRGSPTSAFDLSAGVLALVARAGHQPNVWGETYHLAGTGSASWFDLAAALMDQARSRGLPAAKVEPITSDQWPTPVRRPAYSVLDSRKFAGATGFTMPCWRDSLGTIVARIARDQQG